MGKQAKTTEVILTEENIVKELEKKNRMTTALNDQMIAEINKEKDDKLKREIKERFLKASYQRDLSLLQRRLSKKKNEISLYKIRQTGRLLRFLTGFKVDEATIEYAQTEDDLFNLETLNEKDKILTILIDGKKETFKIGDSVPALLDCIDYDNYKNKIQEKINKMGHDVEKEHNENVRKLNLSYGDYYTYNWNW